MTTTAASLITQGKTAVEAELARIEADLAKAKNAALSDSAALAAELQKYLATHAAEVQTATTLISKATAIAGPVVEAVVTNTVPAATLNKASSIWTKVKSLFVPMTWKHGALIGAGLVTLHYYIGRLV